MAVKKKAPAKKATTKKAAASKAPAKKKAVAAKAPAKKAAVKKAPAKKAAVRKTPVKATEKVRKVKVDNSAEAKKTRKASRQNYRKNKSSILQARRAWERKLTSKDKMRIAERRVYLRAIKGGKSEAEAKAAVVAYRKKIKGAGGHTAAQERAAHAAHIRDSHKGAREQLKTLLAKGKEGYKRAIEAAKKLKDPKARKQARAKAAAGFQKLKAQIAKKRESFNKHKEVELKKIKAANEKERAKKKAAREKAAAKKSTSKGTRTVAASRVKKAAPKAAAPVKRGRKPKAEPAAAAPAKRGRKPKAAKAEAPAPKKKMSRVAKKAAAAAAARAPGKPAAKKAAAKKAPAKKVTKKAAAPKAERGRAKSGSTVQRRRLA